MTHSLKYRMVQSSPKTCASPPFGGKFLEESFERANNYYCLLRLYFTSFPVQPAAKAACVPSRSPTRASRAANRDGGLIPSRNPNGDRHSPPSPPPREGTHGWRPVQKQAAMSTPASAACGGGVSHTHTFPPRGRSLTRREGPRCRRPREPRRRRRSGPPPPIPASSPGPAASGPRQGRPLPRARPRRRLGSARPGPALGAQRAASRSAVTWVLPAPGARACRCRPRAAARRPEAEPPRPGLGALWRGRGRGLVERSRASPAGQGSASPTADAALQV